MNTRILSPLSYIVVTLLAATLFSHQLAAKEVSEADLIAILKSDAPKSEKAITCKRLAVLGTKDAVEELAKLLPDPQLTSWARTALEVIPDPAAGEALRAAMATMSSGRPLIGVINSIATRRDEQAVEGLNQHLQNDDEQVSVAAAVALGHIANAAAQQALETALDHDADAVRSAVAEGCILVAERSLESGHEENAAQLYEKIRAADSKLPKQRVLEATRGLILARKSIDLLTEQLHSTDKDFFGLGLRTARELPDPAITHALVTALEQTSPQRQSLVIFSLAQRDREAVLPTILSFAKKGNANVRSSALQVLGTVGDVSTVETLLTAATDGDSAVAQSAKDALASVQDTAVDDSMKNRLSTAKGDELRVIIETIGARQIDAVPALLEATGDADAAIRAAALTALGETIQPHDLAKLIGKFTNPKHSADSEIAQRALLTASIRMPDRDACASELTAAMAGQSMATQAALIEILGSVGGTTALETVANAAADDREALKDAASQALGKWMTPDAAPELLKLAQPKADEKYRIRALRGYLRIARQMQLTAEERADMCEEALKVAARDEERELALKVMEIHKIKRR